MLLGIMPFQAVLFQGGPAESGKGIVKYCGGADVERNCEGRVHDGMIANDSKTDLPWKSWWYH
jgi:hypothetical protein